MPFLTKGKTNWKYILILLILAVIVGGGIVGYLKYFKKEMIFLTKFPEIKRLSEKIGCDWRPTKDYGPCEELLGFYYNGEKCVALSGCPNTEDIPFQTMEECKSLCEKDETANWKTYRNEEYGFEIKYPQDWYVYLTNPFRIEIEKNVIVFSNFSKKQIEILIDKIEAGQKPEELKNVYSFKIRKIQKPVDEWIKENREIAEMLGVEILEEKISVNDIEGYRIVGKTKESKKIISLVLYKEANTYLIETSYPQECRSDWISEKCKVFRQILSNFRFLE